MWPLSDEALVAGFAAGDTDAATAFVRRYQARVFGLAVTMVGDPTVAEEIAQEAFTRAWRRADSYDARRGRVVTWLLAITRNLAIDHLDPFGPGICTNQLRIVQESPQDFLADVRRQVTRPSLCRRQLCALLATLVRLVG